MTQGYPEDDLYDPYEAQASGGGAPVVSWKYSRPGDTFTGVVVPPDVARLDKGYKMGREYSQGTDTEPDDTGFMVWPPKNNKEQIKRPVTESKFALNWPHLDVADAQKVSRVNVTLVTTLTSGEFLSDSAKARMEDADPPIDPNTVVDRRVIVSGADLVPKVNAALKAAGGKPLPGQTWTIKLIAREPNVGRLGTTSRYEVTVTAPTEGTKAIVAKWVEIEQARQGALADSQDATDPYVGPAAAGAAPSEPPF